MSKQEKVAVVTGGNRGIGFEICRGLAKKGMDVLLTGRDESKIKEAAEELKKDGKVTAFVLDVTHAGQRENLKKFLENEKGRVDVLVNNAAVFIDHGDAPALQTDPAIMVKTFETNTLGPVYLTQLLVPLMKKNGYGRIVNLSSGMGQLNDMQGGHPGYRISKTALNAWTRIAAAELNGSGILVNVMCPGWVHTEMGGADAPRTPEQGADTAVWLATLPDDGPTGGYFRDREPMTW